MQTIHPISISAPTGGGACRPEGGLGGLLTAALLALSALFSTGTSRAAIYNVGPNAGQLPKLASVPWGSLKPGDMVNIYPNATGYHEIIQISESGTAQNPITIRGIPDPNTGSLPVIDGADAVMDPKVDFRNAVFEELGVILVTPRKTGYLYGKTFPDWINIETLDIRNALYTPDNSITFTDEHGVSGRLFNSFGCGIYIEFAHNLAIRGCEISFNGNGIFANSKNGAAQSSQNLLIEKNYLHDNGQPQLADPNHPGQLLSNGFHEHHIYVESDGAIYQYNRFGPLRTNCHGITIKDRSAGCIVRYNEVTIADGSHAFGILDPQGGSGFIEYKTNYQDAYVYGNLVTVLNTGSSQVQIVWFAAANGPAYYQQEHRGTLYFHHNTVVNHRAGAALFFLTDVTMAGTTNIYEKVDCRNNIFYTESQWQKSIYYAGAIVVTSANGAIDLHNNWFSPKTQVTVGNHVYTGLVTGLATSLVGDANGANNPHFVDLNGADYRLATGANALDAAAPLSPTILPTYDASLQYLAPQGFQPRVQIGTGLDIGALESPAGLVMIPGSLPNNAPVATPKNVTLTQGQSVGIALTGTDPDGDSLVYHLSNGALHGNITGVPPNVIYSPTAGFAGLDSFAFVADDGIALSTPAIVNITVKSAPTNNPPPNPGILTVTLTSPPNGKIYTNPATVLISATASSPVGIKQVIFYQATTAGTNVIGSSTVAPYSITWSNPPLGISKIWARAIDNADTPATPSRVDSVGSYIMIVAPASTPVGTGATPPPAAVTKAEKKPVNQL
jgi:hypothetical protein